VAVYSVIGTHDVKLWETYVMIFEDKEFLIDWRKCLGSRIEENLGGGY
jgi:hypothetical protein